MADRLEKLKDLEARLLVMMDASDEKTLPALARQYRETIKEISEIEGAEIADDEIGSILQSREADGKPGAVRKNRTEV